ncbi:MAG: sterol desaturase family protein [Bdellovibrionales bacterium]|nr:sterol desaturase family protein [Bdellovibrionales bacterium]
MLPTDTSFKVILIALSVFHVALMFGEYYYSRKRAIVVYTFRETLMNILISMGNNLINTILPLGVKSFFLVWAFQFAPWNVGTGVGAFIVTFIVTDFFYYWQHRLNHELDILWAVHEVHHSSTDLNLSTGARTSWIMAFLGGILYMPLALLGFQPGYIMVSLVYILFLQWWCHTRVIGQVPLIEGVINTPASHRLHHHPNSRRNYAGFLMIWDRIFGTYVPEKKITQRFGIGEEITSFNPVWITFRGVFFYLKSLISKLNAKVFRRNDASVES